MRSPSLFLNCHPHSRNSHEDAILDGEIVAWEFPADPSQAQQVVDEKFSDAGEKTAEELGHARPFSILQQRLGRKKVSEKMLREVPVAFLAFDVLYANGELLIDRPLRERAPILDDLIEEIHRSAKDKDKRKTKTVPISRHGMLHGK